VRRLVDETEQASGARFLRADLQVHTPRDAGWSGARPKSSDERREVARDYLQAAADRGIELVAITEHHDVSWIDDLRYAAKAIGIHLLPGFEVESREGVHVLCLFDPETPVVQLEDILARLGLTTESRTSSKLTEVRAECAMPDLVRLVQDDAHGICIAAHMTSHKGLLNMGRGGARADYWICPDLLAGQLSTPPDEVTSDGVRRIVLNEDPAYRRTHPMAYVLTSDARSVETIGTASVWIKMHQIGVAGLRQAFLDPQSRISYSDPADRGRTARLLAVAWSGGFLGDAVVAFSDELSCLIGGKGTGKSTVIESVRYAFDLPSRTDEVRNATETLRKSALPSGSKISVLVETAAPKPERFLVERTAPHPPVVRDTLGQALPGRKPGQLFEPRLYGQKEVYGVAQDVRARLGLLDTFAADELRDSIEHERELLRQLERNAQVLLATRRQVDDVDVKLGELPALEDWRRRFREAGFEDRLRERRQLDRQEQAFVAADQALHTRLRALVTLGNEQARLPDSPADVDTNEDLIKRLTEIMDKVQEGWDSAIETLRSDLEQARSALGEVRAIWGERRAARQADFDAALRELQARMPDVDPERYLDVERRIEQLTPLRETRPQLITRLQETLEERQGLLLDLQDTRGGKHRARTTAASVLTEATDKAVLVEVGYQSERGDILDQLTRLKTGARAESLRRMVYHEDFTPAAFASAVRDRELTNSYDLPDGQAALLEREISEEALILLEVTELHDAVTIALDVGPHDTRDYRTLDHLSPGQKSTAILLLIMQASSEPLLIDQPEDDLDNRFIYDDIVQRLRETKARRQVVVATHNANIPVLGDAEQIIVLDATDRAGPKGEVVTRGSIDDEDVRDSVERILEGGQEAFAQRRAKYGW
jgi:energy-coupling factor transporter ATP-binding protein EcfA2